MENEHDRKEDEHEIQEKLTSILLALLMTLGLSVTAFAAGEGSITIDNAVVGQTYTIYQILELESYNKDTGAYSYKATADWEAFIKSDGIKDVYVEVNDEGYVTWKGATTDDRIQAFAKLAQAEATKAGSTITATKSMTATDTTVKFDNLELGWYLVDSTLGTLCSLDTTTPNVTMKEKNEVPENKKEVQEDSNNKYGETNDADIGQTVNFKSTITAQAGAENYVFHDKMSDGLTFGSVTGITLNGNAVAAENYTVKTTGFNDGCTFEVEFTQAFCDTLKANDKIVISYTATVNANAVVGVAGNPNESKLEYGEKGKTTTTPPSKTTTYTWDMEVLKYGNGDENNVLKDAKFVLLNKDKNKVATVENDKLTGWVDVPAAGADGTITWPENTVLTTDENGKIKIEGLDSDTYYLREIEAPAGYNKLANDVEVLIAGAEADAEGNVTHTPTIAKVNNQSGTELPSTGGIGTTIFYVVGAILVVGAGVLLVVKKRMKDEA